MDVTINTIKDIIKKEDLNVDVEGMEAEVPLKEYGIDSLDMYSILLKLEVTFEIKIPDEDVDKLDNLKNIMNYIKEES
jgi:acyl carrier protein|tara:strand:+ start:105 stop:338 length:234 start_codon:yes stop_codon:yes gene_type:complete